MVFSSLFFLFGFLPAFFALYFLAPATRRNTVLLIGSGLFYAWGAPRFVPVVLATSWIDFRLSKQIGDESLGQRRRKLLLALTITLNSAILLYFKYANFFVGQINEALAAFGTGPVGWVEVALPIGISFITFEKISYLVDVYTRRVKPAPTFGTYLLFLALFPHLIAGPIFRYHDVAEQLLARTVRLEDLFYGMQRFILGLAKKVLIADPLSEVVEKVFGLRYLDLSPGFAWLGALAYALQIYYDFSGYSDMAIGLGRMMGFHFLENFDRPYLAQSVSEFWRRWHISLSNWMREYLYYPLGGNRGGRVRTAFNLWTVFLVSGLWHGANWTFLFWGFYHGLFLILDRLFLLKALRRIPSVCRTALTFVIVIFGWIPFRSPNLREAFTYWHRMLQIFAEAPHQRGPLLAEVISNRALFAFAVGAALAFLPWTTTMRPSLMPSRTPRTVLGTAALGTVAIGLFFLSTLALTNSQFHPFIYFRF